MDILDSFFNSWFFLWVLYPVAGVVAGWKFFLWIMNPYK
jgi:hypothetical protein